MRKLYEIFKLLWIQKRIVAAAIIWGNTVCIVNCADSAREIGYGLDNQSLGNSCNYNSYGRKNIFASGKIFGRFYNQVPKNKYCHEFTKGHFSQSSLKKVKNYIFFVSATRPEDCEECCSFIKRYCKILKMSFCVLAFRS